VAGRPDILRRREAGADAASAPVPPRVRTLIVDDSETVRVGLSQLLRMRSSVELVGAVSEPDAALDLARTAQPDVVLQDFSMPGVDSIALVRALSACRPQPAVLMLSAFADAPSARAAFEAGAIGWVLKDAEPEELFAAVLGAAGFRAVDRPPAVVPPPEHGPEMEAERPSGPDFDITLPLDARTVWALLRALEGDPAGLTIESLANRAVLPVGVAARYLQKLSTRHPHLVTAVGAAAAATAYVITGAGHRELARLECRIPEASARAHATPPLL
jgi:CheY-like chemotaxis protein